MFCMNCGQQLPEGAMFCMNCGIPQGSVSPRETRQAEHINLGGMLTFVPAMCPNCSAHMKVDIANKVARCDTCGTECLVQEAIKALTVRGNVQVGNATINVSGSNIDSLLQRIEIMLGDGDFSGALSKCDTVLDIAPTDGRVYFFMLMSDLRCRTKKELGAQEAPFDGNPFCVKAMQYGNLELRKELRGYIDAVNARLEYKQRNPKVGDEIYFGANKKQRILWKVLCVREHRAFIISVNNITKMAYHQSGGAITWEYCTLRKWLNNDFIQGYFTPAEQARILSCKLNNAKNTQFKTPGGKPTNDKVFLLSIEEVYTAFSNDQERANGSWWWLRSPGNSPDFASRVYRDGSVSTVGSRVYIDDNGVRPVMWIKLD